MPDNAGEKKHTGAQINCQPYHAIPFLQNLVQDFLGGSKVVRKGLDGWWR